MRRTALRVVLDPTRLREDLAVLALGATVTMVPEPSKTMQRNYVVP